MNADGTAARGFEVLNTLGDKTDPHFDLPTFSSDSKRVSFMFGSDFVYDSNSWQGDLYTVGVNGSGLKRLDLEIEPKQMPAFSPDGQKVAFVRESEIYCMNRDGSDLKRLTNNLARDFSPLFSPDNQKIVWVSDREHTKNVTRPDGTFGSVPNNDIYSMNIDGSGQKRLTNDPSDDFVTQWLR